MPATLFFDLSVEVDIVFPHSLSLVLAVMLPLLCGHKIIRNLVEYKFWRIHWLIIEKQYLKQEWQLFFSGVNISDKFYHDERGQQAFLHTFTEI